MGCCRLSVDERRLGEQVEYCSASSFSAAFAQVFQIFKECSRTILLRVFVRASRIRLFVFANHEFYSTRLFVYLGRGASALRALNYGVLYRVYAFQANDRRGCARTFSVRQLAFRRLFLRLVRRILGRALSVASEGQEAVPRFLYGVFRASELSRNGRVQVGSLEEVKGAQVH